MTHLALWARATARPCLDPARALLRPRWLAGWAGLLLLALIGSELQAAPPQNLVLDVTPGALVSTSRKGADVTVVIRNNQTNLREQIERLRTPHIVGLLVLSGQNQETILRMTLAPGVVVTDTLSRNPSRLILGLRDLDDAGERPARVDGQRASAQRGTSSPTGLSAIASAGAESLPEGQALESMLAQMPIDQATLLVLDAAEPPRRAVDLDRPIFCIGSRVMYPVPLPPESLTIRDWNPPNLGELTGAEAALVGRGLALLSSGKPAEAEQEFRKFERRFPASPFLNDVRYLVVEARFAAAKASGRSSLRLEAIERLRDQLRLAPKSLKRLRPLYVAGLTYLDLKYYAEASTMFRDVLAGTPEADPNRVKVLVALGWSDYHRFANEDALLAYRTAFPLLDTEWKREVLLSMTTLMAQKGWYKHVLDLLVILKQHYPETTKSLLYRVLHAESLYRLDRFEESRVMFEQIRAEMGRATPRLYEYRIGEALMVAQRLKEARRQFLAPSLESSADKRKWQEAMQQLRNLQMDMLVDKDSPGRLVVNLEKLRKLRSDSPFAPVAEEAMIEFIKYYIVREMLTDSLGILKTFLVAHPSNSHHRTMLQLVWKQVQEQLERDFKAERYFEMLGLYEKAHPVVMVSGNYESSVNYLVARAYANLGLFDMSYRTLSEGFFIEGSSQVLEDRSLLMLAEVQRGQGKHAEARKALAFVRARNPGPETVKLAHLEDARNFAAEGQVREAVTAWREYANREEDPANRALELTRAGAYVVDKRGCDEAMALLRDAAAAAKTVVGEARERQAETFYQYGQCLFELKRYEEAANALRDALSRQPVHQMTTFARYAIGRSYLQTKREADGELLLKGLASELGKNPEDPWMKLASEELDQLSWRRSLGGSTE